MVTDRDIYFFDLNGFIVLRQALGESEVRELNAALDAIPRIQVGHWYGGIHCTNYGSGDGQNYQQIYEAGEPFERLIDHPAWFEHMKTFLGGQKIYDSMLGPAFIDECFASFRGPGESLGMHSGADIAAKHNQYRIRNGKFMCMQINALMAVRDIGPGDGGTVVIPCSHKQNFRHPDFDKHRMHVAGQSGDNLPGAVEVFLKAGDVLLFADSICHGSARRINPGERRVIVYRYNPSFTFFRGGYRPTPELLDRLTPARRQIVWPHRVMRRTPNDKPGFTAIDPTDTPTTR